MSLTVETGAGIEAAESYVTVAEADAYWAARTHSDLYTTWSAGTNTTAKKEGELREASAYIDAVYGPFYIGERAGFVQGLLWPRSNAKDGAGFPLPLLPAELKAAVCELAVRAVSGPLMPDADRGNAIKSETKTVGPLSVSTTYMDSASSKVRYSIVDGIMAPLVTNASGGDTSWDWR